MPAYQPTYNLLVVDDHQLMLDGLSGILKEEKLIAAIYTAVNGQDAIDQVMRHEIDCVLMDINMPGINGLDATKIIKQKISRPQQPMRLKIQTLLVMGHITE